MVQIHNISIHAPRAGSDGAWTVTDANHGDFNPRSPCGERRAGRNHPRGAADFNPRSPCGERPSRSRNCEQRLDFNPRSPCGERPRGGESGLCPEFQSTLPVRGATLIGNIPAYNDGFQSTLPVRGATVYLYSPGLSGSDFNPRSPCGERHAVHGGAIVDSVFQSTLPVRGATYRDVAIQCDYGISIHAPRAGSDDCPASVCRQDRNFNPRSPCGERHEGHHDLAALPDFNPRSPCGERQNGMSDCQDYSYISIHAPRAGSDAIRELQQGQQGDFNPRSPCGERPYLFA